MRAVRINGNARQGDGYTLEACGYATLQNPAQTSMWPFFASMGDGGSRVILGISRKLYFSDATSATARGQWSANSYGCINGTTATLTISHPVGYSSRSVYANGAVQSFTKTSYTSNATANTSINIGGQFWTTGEKIHCVRVYSRALTAAEIAANYAIDKARFGF